MIWVLPSPKYRVTISGSERRTYGQAVMQDDLAQLQHVQQISFGLDTLALRKSPHYMTRMHSERRPLPGPDRCGRLRNAYGKKRASVALVMNSGRWLQELGNVCRCGYASGGICAHRAVSICARRSV